jgi:hypothetical protein
MELSGQLHAQATSPSGRNPSTHWIGRWVGPRTGLTAVARKKDPSPRRKSSHSPARSLVTALTELPRLTMYYYYYLLLFVMRGYSVTIWNYSETIYLGTDISTLSSYCRLDTLHNNLSEEMQDFLLL